MGGGHKVQRRARRKAKRAAKAMALQKSPGAAIAEAARRAVGRFGWLGAILWEHNYGRGGMTSRILWVITTLWVIWSALSALANVELTRHARPLRRVAVRIIVCLMFAIASPFVASWVFSRRPAATYSLGPSDIPFAAGQTKHGVEWKDNYRMYPIELSNPRSSQEMYDVDVRLDVPAVIVHYENLSNALTDRLEIPATGNGRLIREGPKRGELKVVDEMSKATNSLKLKLPALHPGESIKGNMILDWDQACEPTGAMEVQYVYNSYFGDEVRATDARTIDQGPALSLKLASELPACEGSYCQDPSGGGMPIPGGGADVTALHLNFTRATPCRQP